MTAIAANNKAAIREKALIPPLPRNRTSWLLTMKVSQTMNIFSKKDISTIHVGNCVPKRSKVVIAAGPTVRGVPIGTTATISSLIISTILPVPMYWMERKRRMIPPAMAKAPTEIPNTLKRNCPRKRKKRPTRAAVTVAMLINFRRSIWSMPSLREITKGKLPTASITMKRGTKVRMKDSIIVCGATMYIVAYQERLEQNAAFDSDIVRC